MSDAEQWQAYYARTEQLPPPERTAPFLGHLPAGARVLDVGTGSGRWAAAFQRDRPDLTIDLLDQHLDHATCIPPQWHGETYTQSFQHFTPTHRYHGIWAFAVLFFLPPADFATFFQRLCAALVPQGVLFMDMVTDNDVARSIGFHGMVPEQLHDHITQAGLTLLAITEPEATPYTAQKILVPNYRVRLQRMA